MVRFMPVRKIAISLPEHVLAEVDDLARRLDIPRSRLIARILGRVASHKRDDDVRAAVDRVFANRSTADEQRVTSAVFASLQTSLDADW